MEVTRLLRVGKTRRHCATSDSAPRHLTEQETDEIARERDAIELYRDIPGDSDSSEDVNAGADDDEQEEVQDWYASSPPHLRIRDLKLTNGSGEVEATELSQLLRERDWLVALTRLLMGLPGRIPPHMLRSLESSLDRPKGFDVSVMLLEGGLEKAKQSILADESFIVKTSFTQIPGISRSFFTSHNGRLLLYSRCDADAVLLMLITAPNRARELYDEDALHTIAQLKASDRLSSSQVRYLDAFVKEFCILELSKRKKKLGGDVRLLNVGSFARGRRSSTNHDVAFFKDGEWTPGEVKKVLEVQEKKALVYAKLGKEVKKPYDVNRDLAKPPPLAEGLFYVEVLAGSPKDGGQFLQRQWYATMSSFVTFAFLLQASPKYGDAACRVALAGGYVLRPAGLFLRRDWDAHRTAVETKEDRSLAAITLYDEKELSLLLHIPHHGVMEEGDGREDAFAQLERQTHESGVSTNANGDLSHSKIRSYRAHVKLYESRLLDKFDGRIVFQVSCVSAHRGANTRDLAWSGLGFHDHYGKIRDLGDGSEMGLYRLIGDPT
ncbi:hypothetical protein JCM11491_005323 [Sporobolomyces phaffii]